MTGTSSKRFAIVAWMTRAGLFLACVLSVSAQQSGEKPTNTQANQTPAKVDPQTHADAMKLVEVNGMKDRLAGNMNGIIESGRTRMLATSPNCNAAFGDEWVKRMQAQLSPDSFVQIAVSELETHIGDADLKQLIQFQEAAKANPQNPPVLPADFKQRISGPMSQVQAQILSDFLKMASKRAEEVGTQIKKDHPEYCPAATEKPKGE